MSEQTEERIIRLGLRGMVYGQATEDQFNKLCSLFYVLVFSVLLLYCMLLSFYPDFRLDLCTMRNDSGT